MLAPPVWGVQCAERAETGLRPRAMLRLKPWGPSKGSVVLPPPMPEVRSSAWALFAACIALMLVPSSAVAQRSTPIQLLHPSGTESGFFGASVAVDGDTMIVGAPGDDIGGMFDRGSAHIYRWDGATWALEATLLAADGVANEMFGSSVAVSGDTVLVGMPEDVITNGNQGSAYIFVRPPGGATWTQQAKLTASDWGSGDLFGCSVALSGDTALIGAKFDDALGSAYVFTRSGSAWAQVAKLTAPDGAQYDQFGYVVAISGNTGLVGVRLDDIAGNTDQGSAYVFVQDCGGWTQQAKLTAADGAAGDWFGESISVDGDIAVIGATLDDVGANTDQGSVRVFIRSGGAWAEQPHITDPDGAASEHFGSAVAVNGDTIMAGARQHNAAGTAGRGSITVFSRPATGMVWVRVQRLITPDGREADGFGKCIAIAGDIAIAGVPEDDVGPNINQGSAWVFTRVGSTWASDFKVFASDGSAGNTFGNSVAISGDTMLVGAHSEEVGTLSNAGAAYVYVRAPGGTVWTQQARLIASDPGVSRTFGWSVALDGDTALIGCLDENISAGQAYVFIRDPGGTTWTQQARLTASDAADGDEFGWSVAVSGDTALIGAVYDQHPNGAAYGSFYFFSRSPGGTTWTQQQRVQILGAVSIAELGYSVALSGDTAVIGAPSYSATTGLLLRGSAFVFTRAPGGTTWSQQARLDGPSSATQGSGFARAVAFSGNTILLGSHLYGSNDAGAAFIFARPPGGAWSLQATLVASDAAQSDQFGKSVAIVGNTALVGAWGDDFGSNLSQGSVYRYTRSGSTWTCLLYTSDAADE